MRVLSSSIGAAARFTLGILPVRYAVHVMEGIELEAPLDYSKGDYKFRTSTFGEYKRATRACSKEPETIRWIEEFVRPGDVFFDIGANVGAYSFVAAAHTAENCKIFAFEPSFSTYASLCLNIQRNGCGKCIVPLQIALSDRTGLLTLKHSSIQPGAAFHAIGTSFDDDEVMAVQGWDVDTLKSRKLRGEVLDNRALISPVFSQPTLVFRLDDLIEQFQITPPDHIKIDIDGGEFNFIDGARNTLGSGTLKSIHMEIDTDNYDDIRKIMAEFNFFIRSRTSRSKSFANILFVRE
jgi:FkbM family methyltransferase